MKRLLTLAFCLAAASPAFADDYSDAVNALCERMKGCALQSMGEVDNMPADTRAAVLAGLNAMCEGMQQQYDLAMQSHALYQPAVDCVRSMADLTCEELQAGEDDVTPQCVALREEAEKYE